MRSRSRRTRTRRIAGWPRLIAVAGQTRTTRSRCTSWRSRRTRTTGSITTRSGGTYWSLGDYEKAADEFKKVIEIEPDNVNGYNDLGAVYLQTGRYRRRQIHSRRR